MVENFPPIPREMVKWRGNDRNPAIQLFGRRFFSDQTVPELLVELLLVASSAKRIHHQWISGEHVLPPLSTLRDWPDHAPLEYAAKARLNLKLFAFLGASKLETRHQAHHGHHRELLKELGSPHRLQVGAGTDCEEVLRTLENLFLGFQGVGRARTWCAQSFLPLTKELVAGESIWRQTQAARRGVTSWDEAVRFFSYSQEAFLAHGGEVLYLQICNALAQAPDTVATWRDQLGIGISPDELDPEKLHASLEDGIRSALGACPEAVGKLAAFIDSGVDEHTSERTDHDQSGGERFTACGWCPQESWREGLLFGVELVRLCRAAVDPIERLELMELACAMQVLRSLCAQSARHAEWVQERANGAGPLGFVWALSDPEGEMTVLKQISRRSVKAVQRMIYDGIRQPDITAVVERQKREDEASGRTWRDPYREADTRYGHKLFLTVAKRIGLVVPKRGPGARFVLNDRLLRCLVLSLVAPGKRVTYETFKKLLLCHFGIAVDDEAVGGACEWCGTGRLSTLGGETDLWLERMLDAAGMLIRLSDSCSLVTNPFGGGGEGS